MVYSAVLTARTVVGSSPKPPPMLVNTSASMWIKKALLPCWPPYGQQVSHKRWIWGSHRWESTQGIHPGFKIQGRCHQKSKTRVSVAPQEGLVSSKNVFLKKFSYHIWCQHMEVCIVFPICHWCCVNWKQILLGLTPTLSKKVFPQNKSTQASP